MAGLWDSLINKPKAPNYGAVADASVESARIGAELGEKQLAAGEKAYNDYLTEWGRQFDENKAVTKPVVDAQVALMKQSKDQGDDYYNYGKTFRPLEQSMLGVASDWENQLKKDETERNAIKDARVSHADVLQKRTEWFDKAQVDDLATYTGGDRAIAAKYGADIDGEVGSAMADQRAGQAQAYNSAIRQAMRYGLSVPANVSGVATQGAQAIAAAANNQRNASTSKYRDLVGQGFGMRQQAFGASQAATADSFERNEGAVMDARTQRIQDEAIKWGRGMDMVGVGRGMVGASQGAYGLASSAGASGAATQLQGSGQMLSALAGANGTYLGNMNGANNTIMNGRQIAVGGLGNVLNNQVSQYSGDMSAIGSVIGAGAKMYASSGSARDYKQGIVRIGTHPSGLGVYEFEYREPYRAKWGHGRRVGVMADEVASIMPAALSVDADGHTVVNYSML